LSLDTNKIYQGDCLEVMKSIDDKSIDMILCDLPYGTTACKWDNIIPFEPLWTNYKRIIKDNGAIVLTASQPFTSKLVLSNLKIFRHSWIWEKTRPANFMNAKYQPMKYHEDILVFGLNSINFYPIKTKGEKNHASQPRNGKSNIYAIENNNAGIDINDIKNPSSIIKIKSTDSTQNLHPTQKPVALFEYLIKTYTNEGELVLDNCIGSGTTAIACMQTNRNFIGIELEPKYVDIANKRIEEFTHQLSLV
jgi:site-specific DNA-methyltransferase (adenine-specific)